MSDVKAWLTNWLHRSPDPIGQVADARNSVGNVVMSARSVVDAVATAPACLALEPDELANHAIAVEQLDLPRINQRQEIEIQFRLGLVRQFVVDAALAKLLLRPLTAIVVAGDSRMR